MPNDYSLRPESYANGASREWLMANGIGGYASSTAIGVNTRAYHGLLVAAMKPPTDRRLLLSSLDEELEADGQYQLANHQYPGVINPQGFEYLREFSLDPHPCFSYQAGDSRIEKTVFMIHGENTTIVRYRVRGEGKMRILPLIHCRSFHAASALPSVQQEPSRMGTLLRSECDFFLFSDKAEYVCGELVYYNFEYEAERQRGLPWRENLLNPGCFEISLEGDCSFSIMSSTVRRSMPNVEEILQREKARLVGLKAPLPRLAQAADSFVVKRWRGKSIIAGYHWFDDWGRDAMISLPGLLLTTERFDDARDVLVAFANAMKEGVMPNDLGAESYNTVDASLWFIQAVYSYLQYTEDLDFVHQLWPALLSVVKRYSVAGPEFRMDTDGLIISGPALSWMDARVDGRPITPRTGKACEINALWYRDLRIMDSLAEALGEPWDPRLAENVKASYQRFWNSENGCLFDVLDPEDDSIRPNQIIAASIPELLSLVERKSILEVVIRELMTPYGLRTLSPRDPRYKGRYEGGPRQRDEAYHQGTVWPWLMGPYIDAFLSVNDHSKESIKQAKEILRPLTELELEGINTIPEVFDGDAPQRPGGCVSQAWSVAEVMRAWHKAERTEELIRYAGPRGELAN